MTPARVASSSLDSASAKGGELGGGVEVVNSALDARVHQRVRRVPERVGDVEQAVDILQCLAHRVGIVDIEHARPDAQCIGQFAVRPWSRPATVVSRPICTARSATSRPVYPVAP